MHPCTCFAHTHAEWYVCCVFPSKSWSQFLEVLLYVISWLIFPLSILTKKCLRLMQRHVPYCQDIFVSIFSKILSHWSDLNKHMFYISEIPLDKWQIFNFHELFLLLPQLSSITTYPLHWKLWKCSFLFLSALGIFNTYYTIR